LDAMFFELEFFVLDKVQDEIVQLGVTEESTILKLDNLSNFSFLKEMMFNLSQFTLILIYRN